MRIGRRMISLIAISLLLTLSPLTARPLESRSLVSDQLGMQDVWGVAVQGDRAYLVGYQGIAIVDLTDQAQPHMVKEFSLPAFGVEFPSTPSFWVEVEDGLLYVGSLDGLRIFQLSGDSDLQEIGRLRAERAWSFARIGPWAYLLGQFPNLRGTRLIAVDLSNPSAPEVRGSHAIQLGATEFVASSDLVALRTESTNQGVEILEIRDGYRFVQVGRMRFPENPFVDAMALDGHRLYLYHPDALRILELDGRTGHEIAYYADWNPGFVTRLFVVGDLLFLGGASFRSRGVGEFFIYELANLQQPVGYLQFNTPMNANLPMALIARDRRLYLGEGWPYWKLINCGFLRPPPTNAGLRIIDISDPSAPREVSYLSAGESFVNDVCR